MQCPRDDIPEELPLASVHANMRVTDRFGIYETAADNHGRVNPRSYSEQCSYFAARDPAYVCNRTLALRGAARSFELNQRMIRKARITALVRREGQSATFEHTPRLWGCVDYRRNCKS
jgi:hypothetical protein